MIYAVFGDWSEGVECGLGGGGWNWGARGDGGEKWKDFLSGG